MRKEKAWPRLACKARRQGLAGARAGPGRRWVPGVQGAASPRHDRASRFSRFLGGKGHMELQGPGVRAAGEPAELQGV
jgi:hypothetical protein